MDIICFAREIRSWRYSSTVRAIIIHHFPALHTHIAKHISHASPSSPPMVVATTDLLADKSCNQNGQIEASYCVKFARCNQAEFEKWIVAISYVMLP